MGGSENRTNETAELIPTAMCRVQSDTQPGERTVVTNRNAVLGSRLARAPRSRNGDPREERQQEEEQEPPSSAH